MGKIISEAKKFPEKNRDILKNVLILCSIFEGCFSLYMLLRIPSEAKNAIIFGFSKSRLILLTGNLIGILFFIILFLILALPGLNFTRKKLESFTGKPVISFLILAICWIIFLVCSWLLILRFSPANEFDSTVGSIVNRMWGFLLWGILLSIQTIVIILISPSRKPNIFTPFRTAVFFALFMLVYYGFASYYDQIDWSRRMNGLAAMVMIPSVISLIWAGIYRSYERKKWAGILNAGVLCLLIGTLVFFLYRSTGLWMGRWNTPSKAYWDLLAEAFLNGKLYLSNPPTTHDLTMFNGRWFVPNPPLPAILLMPFVKWYGTEGVNMTVVSAVIGALNSVLVFLVLKRAADHQMTKCGLSANLWITAVFALGTNHIWLATIGQMWFVSQLVTILFVSLACLSAIEGWSGWFSGLFLGLGILARPNVFPIAIFLAGIYLWQQADFPQIPWKRLIIWGFSAAVPVVVSVGILLYYNYIRFEDWFDFGYVTINGADWILEAVQKYGMFNFHFFWNNLDVMIFRRPRLDFSGERFFFQPGISGFSIFIMTPPFIYLSRRMKKDWWMIGAWLSVFLTVGLLLCYHNTGAEQVGYRYIMDTILPILLIIGVGVGKKPSLLFRILAVFGVIINSLSIYWWYIGRA